MEYYDKQYDRVTTKNEKKLKRINRVFHKVTTTDDPVIRGVSHVYIVYMCTGLEITKIFRWSRGQVARKSTCPNVFTLVHKHIDKILD